MGSGCGSVGRRFQFQGSAVRIQSTANIYIDHFTFNCVEKTKIKKKRLGMAHFSHIRFELLLFQLRKGNLFFADYACLLGISTQEERGRARYLKRHSGYQRQLGIGKDYVLIDSRRLRHNLPKIKRTIHSLRETR